VSFFYFYTFYLNIKQIPIYSNVKGGNYVTKIIVGPEAKWKAQWTVNWWRRKGLVDRIDRPTINNTTNRLAVKMWIINVHI
jgi:hypothetical protein